MEHIENLHKIMRIYATDKTMRRILMSQLVDNGVISRIDLNRIFSPQTKLQYVDPAVLALVYRTLYAFEKKRKIPAVNYFFSDIEIDNSMLLTARDTFESYPIVFDRVTKISMQDEYCFCLSMQQIQELSSNRLLRIYADMQRESEIVKYRGEEIPCVKYSEKKVSEIKENILNGTQHPNTLRIHLIPDVNEPIQNSFEYNEETEQIIVKKGLLANIDGNHRINAIIDAMYINCNLGKQYKMPVIFTVGSPLVAREIIVQEEERTPINRGHILSLKQTEGNRVVGKLKTDTELSACFKFVSTIEQHSNGGGFIVDYMLSDAIIKYFKIKNKLRPTALTELSNYLSKFLVECYYIIDDKDSGYWDRYADHRENTMSNEYTIYGLMYMASILQENEDWNTQLEQWLQAIDLSKVTNKHYVNMEKHIINFVKSCREGVDVYES